MTNYICIKCAEANDGKFKGERYPAVQLYLGPCNVCKEVAPITPVQYWQNIASTKSYISHKDARKRGVSAVKPQATKPLKLVKTKPNNTVESGDVL